MSEIKRKYIHKDIEKKWQEYWKKNNKHSADIDESKKKFYLLEMFPYPSGKLHMGHVRNYSIGDVIYRHKRMKGYNVLHPMGWDSFGMPAEDAAIKHKTHPYKWTLENISAMKKELKSLGYAYDWEREVTTCTPDYYRWEQVFFLRMLEKGLAYRKESPVNWCENCNTVLANEQVVEGCCWRCDNEVTQKKLRQWFLKITDYAEELLADCDTLDDWPEKVTAMQKNWIGKSQGVEINFAVCNTEEFIRVFTTRPDTLYGASFVSIACGHPLLKKIMQGGAEEKKVMDFSKKVLKEQKLSRDSADLEKEGVFTGKYAINPINNEKVPIYVANFVLMGYGTGAVMAVPAHDQRDFEFAKKYGLPIKIVIQPKGKELDAHKLTEAYTEPGIMVNSAPFDGIDSITGKGKVTDELEKRGLGKRKVQYRLRDWGISRQRYWGNPIPIIYCEKCGAVPVPEKSLPVVLPTEVELLEKGRSPLPYEESFVSVKCPKCGKDARRETDTMDTFIESSWYFLRFVSPRNNKEAFNSDQIRYWLPVDQYIGGVEHAILHLLYSRFFTKVLRDLGFMDLDEPFKKLLTQGMVIKDGFKMSKSKGNVVNPTELVEKYGADTVRVFILFASPPEKELEWNDNGVEGAHRFLNRVWVLALNLEEMKRTVSTSKKESTKAIKSLRRKTHETIKRVSLDIGERLHFNTGISAIMELVNECYLFCEKNSMCSGGEYAAFKEAVESMTLLLSPFAPHMCDEIWGMLGNDGCIIDVQWPEFDEKLIQKEEDLIVVQVNGKLRCRFSVPVGTEKDCVKEMALKEEKIVALLNGNEPKKVIVIPSKLVNIVV